MSQNQTLPAPVYAWPEFADHVGELWKGFRPAEACDIAAAMFQPATPRGDGTGRHITPDNITALADGTGRYLHRPTGELLTEAPTTCTLSISGGVISMRVNTITTDQPTPAIDDGPVFDGDDLEWDQPDGQADDGEDDNTGVVQGFSRRSRMRLRAAGASIDWAAAQTPASQMAMLTLTYPDDWRTACPTPADLLAQRKALEKRFKRATGYRMRFLWKREFQERGAPHLHMYGWWPRAIADEWFTKWLSANWYEVVGTGNPLHLQAGTGVDHEESLKMSDPNRVGNYFASYASNGKYKDYQNVAPEGWVNPNGSVGRYWGYVGLQRMHADVQISHGDMMRLERLLRSYLASQKRTHRSRSSRNGTRLDGNRKRYTNKRYKLPTLKGTTAGFTFLTNDAPALAVELARAITQPQDLHWPTGKPRPLP
ncbi:MAG: hypothetical protein AAGA59_01615 [Actinomycetota bacterium]